MKIGTQLTLEAQNQVKTITGNSRLKILLLPIILTASFCGGMAWFVLDAYQSLKKIGTEDIAIIDLSNQVTYLDEVLTSSARLATSTGDQRWEKRYLEYVPTPFPPKD
jgi:hypothetical protein